MGSKRVLLKNGLGNILKEEANEASRVVDLFCGSAAVSRFAATELDKPVLSCDLQQFATTLAGSIVKRTVPIQIEDVEKYWLRPADEARRRFAAWADAECLDNSGFSTEKLHRRAQKLSSQCARGDEFPIYRCYGGHYFSPMQALTFDALIQTLPEDENLRDTCLAATIVAASQCAAAPGHTAQPFKATGRADKYLREAWDRDPFKYVRQSLRRLCPLHARYRGETRTDDANEIAGDLCDTDLAFVDPPYSSVQYSRFYHVLETVARGGCGPVRGVGRYPPFDERPNSSYSKKGTSSHAISSLLETLADRGCRVVLTFPSGECSNGLSGNGIKGIAQERFPVVRCRSSVKSSFSTLGGNSVNRDARKKIQELIFVLKHG